MHIFIQNLIKFIRDEEGIATAWAIGWLILCFAIAGLSIDATNAWKVKQILQSTADIAAHSGGLELDTVDNSNIEAVVIVAANEYATKNMSVGRYGDVLADSDIQVGFWDRSTRTFSEMNGATTEIPNAVRVVTRQDGVNSSKVGTFFLRFAGFDAFTVSATATVEKFVSQCEQDGLIARGQVKMSTQQSFLGNFCVYGLGGIDASDQNYFAYGTTAGMVDLDDCGPLPENCTNEYNPGIEEALRESNMTFGKIDRIDENIAKLQDLSSDIIPWYITDTTINKITLAESRDFEAFTDLVEGAINIIQCRNNQNISLGGLGNLTNNGNNSDTGTDAIEQHEILSKLVIVGINCDFSFDQTIAYEDAYIATTATGNQTFSGSADTRLGENDNCADEGEVTLITAGNVSFAAKLDAYDLEIVAAGDVGFASHANDQESIHKGTNVWAGGDIKVTTKHTFEPCGEGGDSDYDVKYTLRFVE